MTLQNLWLGVIGAAILVAGAIVLQLNRFDETGVASWYGPGFNGNLTANGEVYDMYEVSAAHKSLPFGSIVRITDLETGKSLVVRINDRGPFVDGRIIDLSYGAARLIGLSGETPRHNGRGITKVGIKVLVKGDGYYVKRPE